jgi:hypothetical protein
MSLPVVVARERLGMFLFDVHQQFGWPFLTIASAGLVALARVAPARMVLLAAWLICTSVFALTYNVGDPHVFLLPTHLVLAALTAPGITWLAEGLAPVAGRLAQTIAAATAAMLAVARIVDQYPALDRSQDQRPTAVLEGMTADIDDRRAVLLTDLNWQLQNGLNYYAQHVRADLTFARLPEVLAYAPALIRDNHAIGREVLATERASLQLAAAYGPLFTITRDPRVPSLTIAERVVSFPAGARYVLSILKPTPDIEWDPADTDLALARLTGGRVTSTPRSDYVAIAGRVGQPPSLVQSTGRPFRTRVELDGLALDIRMESWLAFDTIRRMGFGHVLAGRHHALVMERGVSLVVLADDGRPTRTEYAAGIFAPQARFLVAPAESDP